MNVNYDCYQRPGVVEHYASKNKLQAPEAVILSKYHHKIKNKAILDIGIGTGRTTNFLSPLSKNYIGIDYAPRMIEICKKNFPEANTMVCDVRSMPFEEEQFDFILFSFNGIDHVEHHERISILNNIRKLLKPDGIFCFSTHNLDCNRNHPFSHHRFKLYKNPLKLISQNAKELPKFSYGFYNWMKNKKYERYESEYAIIRDLGHDYGLVLYYISRESQLNQLTESLFSNIEVLALDGSYLKANDSSKDVWLYYVMGRKN
ncbi:MAG: methyltransferase domain-containing protein [Flavobacteriales bacterium]|nr:methyltransferase domain-containing protein [Flavobacteriales bacterium]